MIRTGTRTLLGAIGIAFTCAATLLPALPPQYFAADIATPSDLAGWTALAEAQPHRVRVDQAPARGDDDVPPATQMDLRPGINYVRVRRLARDLAVIEAALARPQVIIDLRTIGAEFDESSRLGSLLARRAFSLPAPTPGDEALTVLTPSGHRAADQQTILLVNRGTHGPLEAVLAALQQAGDVLLVGTATAGDTGYFLPVQEFPTIRVIAGEFVATRGASLLDRGVAAGLVVEVAPAADEAAYLALDNGIAPADLLDPPVDKARFDEALLLSAHAGTSTRTPPNASPPAVGAKRGTGDAVPSDRILQRAVNVLVARGALKLAP